MANEIVELAVAHGSWPAIRLNHEHLVGFPGVNVLVNDVRNGSIHSQGANGASTRPVTKGVLDENIACWALDGNAFILVGDFHVMDPDVGSPNIDSVEATFVAATYDHIVDLAACAGIKSQVKSRRINKRDIMDREVCGFI